MKLKEALEQSGTNIGLRSSIGTSNEDVTIPKNKRRKLIVMDFDDTLMKTDSKVKIKKSNGETMVVTPATWSTYDPDPNDITDFSEFDKLINPRPIKWTMDILRKSKEKGGKRKTVILTARSVWKPIKDYLRKKLGTDVFVINLGTGSPQAKSDYIEKEIKRGYNDVEFFEDSIKNIRAVDSLKKKYPNVKIRTHLVKS